MPEEEFIEKDVNWLRLRDILVLPFFNQKIKTFALTKWICYS